MKNTVLDKHLITEYRDKLAPEFDKWVNRNKFYHQSIQSLHRSIIPEGSKVLDLGCATGELLSSIKPAYGAGTDFSKNMVSIAKQKFPNLVFSCTDIDAIDKDDFETRFDYIVMSNLVDYLPDISDALSRAKELLSEDGIAIITAENPFWHPLLKLCSILRLRMPDIPRNYLTNLDLKNLAESADFEVIKMGLKFFLPVRIPFITSFLNFIVSETPILRNLCLLRYLVLRYPQKRKSLSCSVIVPCNNEADNIAECIKRVPPIGGSTEILIVDDGSTDGTKKKVEGLEKIDKRVKLISYGQNRGKGYAVKTGCTVASGDVIIILDADMSVPPEELPRFFDPIQNGKADFVNGTRMIYPMKGQAMRPLNYLGNRFFSLILSWLMEQYISDTLCGTKSFLKKDYLKIDMGKCKWGDFELLFGISRLKKKIIEVPVHYQERLAGKSKMRVIKHGFLLAMMCFVGFCRLKLIRIR